jgi:hypothetical protein
MKDETTGCLHASWLDELLIALPIAIVAALATIPAIRIFPRAAMKVAVPLASSSSMWEV